MQTAEVTQRRERLSDGIVLNFAMKPEVVRKIDDRAAREGLSRASWLRRTLTCM